MTHTHTQILEGLALESALESADSSSKSVNSIPHDLVGIRALADGYALAADSSYLTCLIILA